MSGYCGDYPIQLSIVTTHRNGKGTYRLLGKDGALRHSLHDEGVVSLQRIISSSELNASTK